MINSDRRGFPLASGVKVYLTKKNKCVRMRKVEVCPSG